MPGSPRDRAPKGNREPDPAGRGSLRVRFEALLLSQPLLLRIATGLGMSAGVPGPSSASVATRTALSVAWKIVIALGLFGVIVFVGVRLVGPSENKTAGPPVTTAPAGTTSSSPPIGLALEGLIRRLDLRPAESGALLARIHAVDAATTSGARCAALAGLRVRIAADTARRTLTAAEGATLAKAVRRVEVGAGCAR